MAFVLARAGTVCTRQKRGAYISPPLFFLKIIIITPFHKVPTEQPRAARPYNSEHSPEDKEERTQSIIFRPFGFSRFGVDVLAPCLVSGHQPRVPWSAASRTPPPSRSLRVALAGRASLFHPCEQKRHWIVHPAQPQCQVVDGLIGTEAERYLSDAPSHQNCLWSARGHARSTSRCNLVRNRLRFE